MKIPQYLLLSFIVRFSSFPHHTGSTSPCYLFLLQPFSTAPLVHCPLVMLLFLPFLEKAKGHTPASKPFIGGNLFLWMLPWLFLSFPSCVCSDGPSSERPSLITWYTLAPPYSLSAPFLLWDSSFYLSCLTYYVFVSLFIAYFLPLSYKFLRFRDYILLNAIFSSHNRCSINK